MPLNAVNANTGEALRVANDLAVSDTRPKSIIDAPRNSAVQISRAQIKRSPADSISL